MSGELRKIETVTNYHGEMGRSTVMITCPFCGDEVRTYIWSLAGCGKRCPCGVIFMSIGWAEDDKGIYKKGGSDESNKR